MVKHDFNKRWRDRDRAYRRLPNAILEELYGVISGLAEGRRETVTATGSRMKSGLGQTK